MADLLGRHQEYAYCVQPLLKPMGRVAGTRGNLARLSGKQPSISQELANVLHEKEKVQAVRRGLLEGVLHVERLGGLVLGMHKQQACPDHLSSLDAAKQGVLEKRATKPNALVIRIHCEAGQEDRRYRAAFRLALQDPLRCLIRGNQRGCEREVAHDRFPVVQCRDVDPRRVGGLGAKRIPLEPRVKLRLTGLKVIEAVMLPERLGGPVRHRLFGCEDAWLGEELLQTRLLLGWAIE